MRGMNIKGTKRSVFTARYELSLQIQCRWTLDLNAWLLAGGQCASGRSCDQVACVFPWP